MGRAELARDAPHDFALKPAARSLRSEGGALDAERGACSDPPLGESAPRRDDAEPGDDEAGSGGAEHSNQAAFADPLCRGLARPTLEPAAPPRTLLQLDPRLAEMIQRVAWGRQGSSSTLRLELGGKLRGAVLLLQGDDRGGVSVSLELPAGEDPAPWRERLARRLQAKGLSVDALEVV